MYEALVKSLRKCGRLNMGDECVCFHDGCCEAEPTCMYELMRQAADAIEELTATAESYKRSMEAWADEAARAQPRWIPVTEPPKEDGWYQVYAPGYSGGSSSGLKNINGNMYSAFKHGKWSIEVGYHKRPGCVKAWMPLPTAPELPKEETTNFCADCLWYEPEQMYCFRQGNHSYDNGNCELWEPKTEPPKEEAK